MLRLSGLPETLTIEQLASMTEEEMVRRRFDAGNARYVTVLTFLALATAIFQMIFAARTAAYLVLIAFLHLVFAGASTATMVSLARRRRRGAPLPRGIAAIARNLTPWVLTFLIVEFAMLIVLSERESNVWMVWAFTFPWFLIGIRLELSRRIALHAALLGVGAIHALIFVGNHVQNLPPYVSAVIISGIALLAGAGASRRVRRQTIDEWSERRAQARDQLRMRDELQYAREVQLSMLPESPPDMGWVDLAGASLPATEVGGDYYDYFIEEGAVAVVCGDVAGHGLGSGIVLASLRSGFMLLRDSLHDPAAVLQRLNDLVARNQSQADACNRSRPETRSRIAPRHDRQRGTSAADRPSWQRRQRRRAFRAASRRPPAISRAFDRGLVRERRHLRASFGRRVRVAECGR